jgi:rubrerythrin
MDSASSVTRRRLALATASAAVFAAAGCGAEEPPPQAPGGLGTGDLDILDFALGLEVLERDFYERVLESGVLGGEARRLAERIHANEREHATALTKVLRDNRFRPSPAPQVDTALIKGGEEQVLSLAARLEDLGANAYAGAAPDILDRKVLQAALAIHSVEARHAAAVHRLLGTSFVPEGAFAAPLDRGAVREGLREVMR